MLIVNVLNAAVYVLGITAAVGLFGLAIVAITEHDAGGDHGLIVAWAIVTIVSFFLCLLVAYIHDTLI